MSRCARARAHTNTHTHTHTHGSYACSSDWIRWGGGEKPIKSHLGTGSFPPWRSRGIPGGEAAPSGDCAETAGVLGSIARQWASGFSNPEAAHQSLTRHDRAKLTASWQLHPACFVQTATLNRADLTSQSKDFPLAVIESVLKQASFSGLQPTQSCLATPDPVDCSPPGSSVHGILQARVLEWVAIPFSRGPF